MEYAALHGRSARSVRQKAKTRGFRTARKIGHNWMVDADEPYSNNRHGSPDNIMRTRVCRQCGKEFQGGPRAWYCPECRENRRRECDRKWKQKKRAGMPTSRPLGSIGRCEICGAEYIVTSARQRYCPNCAKSAVAAVDRKQAMEHYEAAKETENPRRNERRRVKTKTCVICGKLFPADGTARNTCSSECAKKQRKEWQRKKNTKRRKQK